MHRYLAVIPLYKPDFGHWRLPWKEMIGLVREGADAVNRLRRGNSDRNAILTLERVVQELREADSWKKRLAGPLGQIRTDKARRALDRLVALGCVPDAFVDYLVSRADSEDRDRKVRGVLESHRRRLRSLMADLNRLADSLDSVPGNEIHAPGAFLLDLRLGGQVRKEARRMADYLEAADPRIRRRATREESLLVWLMSDVKRITGSYHDEELAALISEVVPQSPTALRRWRTRELKRWVNVDRR
jgi:hypothetical protein